MTVVEDLRGEMPLREISRVSGISLSSLYYQEKERRVSRLSPQIEESIIRIASERPTYGYRRVWAVLRNCGIRVNRKEVRRVLRERNLSLPYARHRGRTKYRNLFRPTGPDQLWETDITYIPTQQGITYLMCVKDSFTKEWQGYQYSRSCLSRDAIMAVEDAVMRAFGGDVPEGLVLRTDNGPQYIARQFRSSMNLLGISLEYIQKHTPEDNGNIESLHNSIKTDYVWTDDFIDFNDADVKLSKAFIDYSNVRPHSSVDYLPPSVFREAFNNNTAFRSRYLRELKERKERLEMRRGKMKKSQKELEVKSQYA
jgi:transposase InsO family protein